ncbi:MAG: methyltransferase domain-containing protein [Verrucomicrobiales bacterium]|nr:methyltransferase domain-containing protein [Verrucomicrobiales bacterium]
MAHRVDLREDDAIVELGAGTGVVTQALRRRLSVPQQLVAIERAPVLADLLRSQFPDIKVICGDAAKLRQLIRRAVPNCQRLHVVSSLPLRSLPSDQVRVILREIAGVLQTGGSWIQYTYALADRRVPDGFVRVASSFVWRNVPPARIDVFKRESTS